MIQDHKTDQKKSLLELANPIIHVPVFFISQMPIVASRMPRIERMEPDHVEGFVGQCASWMVSEHLIQVFVMAPRHEQLVQAAVWLVNTILCAETDKL